MCLAIPGEILSRQEDGSGQVMGRVRFGSITKEVCLAYVPEAVVGQFVVVHAGFAISVLDEEEARQTLALLAELAANSSSPARP